MQTAMSDLDGPLVQQMRDGTVDYRHWQDYVSRIHVWICRRFPFLYAHSEDLADEAAIRAFLNVRSFRGDAPLMQWTQSVAYYVVCRHLRKYRKLPLLSIEDLTVEPAVDDGVDSRIQLWAVAQAMRSMTRLERDVFVSRTAYDSDHKEIARRLGISSNASRQTWMRAVQKVRHFDQEAPH